MKMPKKAKIWQCFVKRRILRSFLLRATSQSPVLPKWRSSVNLTGVSKGRQGVVPLQTKSNKTGVFVRLPSHDGLKEQYVARC
jgi:hypothetical protein